MLLSIITVNLNNKAGLERTAQSIINQTCQDYEWIVIDGGSTDDSVDVIKKYAEHITYWVSEPDKGIYNAMNKGILTSKGDYLIFMNSGDSFYDALVIDKFIKCSPTEDVLYGDYVKVNGDEIVKNFKAKDIVSYYYVFYNSINHQSAFIQKNCFKGNLYDETLRYSSDQKHFFWLIFNGYKFRRLDFYVSKYDINGISSTEDIYSELNNVKYLPMSEYVKKDYDELVEFYNYKSTDIGRFSYEIVHGSKFCRYLLRLFLYPIGCINKLISLKKETVL